MFAAAAHNSRGQDDLLNLASNASFETPAASAGNQLPDGWGFFTSRGRTLQLTKEKARTGTQSLGISPQQVPGADMGILQKLSVQPKARYTFSAYCLNSKADALKGPLFGVLSIEWLDASGKEIERNESPTWNAGLSRMLWTLISLSAKVPDQAVRANFVIRVNDGAGQSTGTCFVDDVCIRVRAADPQASDRSARSRHSLTNTSTPEIRRAPQPGLARSPQARPVLP
ncbi:MAG: hypothetical protein V1873_06880 [Verrucomicrobiota bacterium]